MYLYMARDNDDVDNEDVGNFSHKVFHAQRSLREGLLVEGTNAEVKLL